jgi:predicted enzyme related to lactoylglutathione lyase
VAQDENLDLLLALRAQPQHQQLQQPPQHQVKKRQHHAARTTHLEHRPYRHHKRRDPQTGRRASQRQAISIFGTHTELIRASCGSYLAFDAGCGFGGGIVECATRQPVWLPYVEVDRIEDCTERARRLGAAVLLEPREGPAGWRSVVSSPEGGEVAFWEPKR